jgi:hypothetical protein
VVPQINKKEKEMMNKKEERTIKVILKELHRRLPKNNNEGFLPSEEVSHAIEYLTSRLYVDSTFGFEDDLHESLETGWKPIPFVPRTKQTISE